MKSVIDYAAVKAFTATISIDDIGNTCVRCEDENNAELFMFVKTVAGYTHILQVGPVITGVPIFCKNFKVEVKQFNYSDKRIDKELRLFLNSNKISSAEVISIEEGLECFPNIAEIFRGLGD